VFGRAEATAGGKVGTEELLSFEEKGTGVCCRPQGGRRGSSLIR